MRILLFTGKGGVGKTSVAAATACRLAEEGKRVLIMSTDQAHSLGDCLGARLGALISPVSENLDAMEIDVVREAEEAWGRMRGYIKRLLAAKTNQGIETEELLVFPGLEELFSLFKILDVYEEKQYEVLIVDCAPTGETLSLLKFPELFGGFLERMLPMKRKMVKTAGPAVEKITKIPMPGEDVFSELEQLMEKLDRLQTLMLDRAEVSVRIVTTPEKIVIREAKRSFTCLCLFDYNVDAVIVNKVYPEEALEGYFNAWVRLQKEGLAEIRESFGEVPVFELTLKRRELRGRPALLDAARLYGGFNPAAVLYRETPFRISREGEASVLEILLPFAEKEEMELEQRGGELLISIKNERRRYALPDSLKGFHILRAKLTKGRLAITFGRASGIAE